MARIKKQRARNFCAAGPPEMGVYPHGVGGVEGKPVLSVRIGDHIVYFTGDEFCKLAVIATELLKECK